MFKKLLASAILLLLAAGTVFAGEKLIDHEKFTGKTKEYTLTWTLNQEYVIPKFTQPISEE